MGVDNANLSTLYKALVNPDYIWSYEFVMKHSNFKDNGDGTLWSLV